MRIEFNGPEIGTEVILAPLGVPLDFEILSAEPKESQNTGKPMLEVKMVNLTEGDGEGDHFYDYFVEPATNKRTQVELNRLATAVGIHVGADGFESEDLIGAKGQFTLKKDMYEGTERRRIADYVLPDVAA